MLPEMSPEIVTLYRYFAYAAHMRSLFRKEFNPEWKELVETDIAGLLFFLFSPATLYLMYSYSGIYLVIEGWQELKLTDPKIDELLDSPFVDRLRRFRNATFHFQKQPLSPKHFQFFGTEEEATEKWLNKLYAEFERFFRENTIPVPEPLQGSFNDKSFLELTKLMRNHFKDIEELRALFTPRDI